MIDKIELKRHIELFLAEGPKHYLPNLSVDCVIFAYTDGLLKVLLPQLWSQDIFTLPGGFVARTEDIDTAALRILHERTGLSDIFLQQFRTFGKAERAFEAEITSLLQALNIPIEKAAWMKDRFVTVGYYALVRIEEAIPSPGLFSEALCWADVKQLPPMAMDHAEIVQQACKLLCDELNNQPIAERLLPRSFTIPELQRLYETILDRPIDRGNFRKKVLKAKVLKRLDQQKSGGAHRAPQLYTFHSAHYEESLKEQVKLGF